MSEGKYKSSVLRTVDFDDHDCPTCRFLRGDHSVEILLAVIENLDDRLHSEEIHTSRLLDIIIADE
jgi:hypothetical protein